MGSTPWLEAKVRTIRGKPGVPTKIGDLYAASYVSWIEASEFCQVLSKKTGLKVTLPSEGQWEYACRAGSTTMYFFGKDGKTLGHHAWYSSNTTGQKHVHRGGHTRPNAWGLYDMYGNVSEWCRDWYDEKFYFRGKSVDPENKVEGKLRSRRGGSWVSRVDHCNSVIRGFGHSGEKHRYIFTGFRVVVESN
jgi:formylglycine-generating enzyme required for sulfatase activity